MKTLYIKFKHPEDVYAINEFYDLSPDDFVPPKVCGRCGDTLYIPVELPTCGTIEQPMGAIHKPFPIERPDMFCRDEPEPITIEFIPKGKLPYYEQQRLKSFPSVCYADENSWSIFIDDFSKTPVKHECEGINRDA